MRTFEEIYKICRPYTMTSEARMKKLYESVVYINEKGIEGSFVECGVYKGGSVMNMILTQLNYPGHLVHTYLYDTFSGMTQHDKFDITYEGIPASEILKNSRKLAIASLESVKKNLNLTGYPEGFLHFRKGDVAETLLVEPPEKIAILRLDTDWYMSTKICLEKLYPKLVSGGVLILDDYGYWQGARKATDEYFASIGINPEFQPIDKGIGAVFYIKN